MLRWNDKFETGHALVDAQHRMLFAYINRLDVMAQTTSPAREDVELFFRFIEFLETYVLTHFKEEEECMHRFRCPAHIANKSAHKEFQDFFSRIKNQIISEGYHLELAKALHSLCREWIERHIMGID